MTEPTSDHERLEVYRFAIDSDLNRIGKINLKRIVSMLTRLIQRTDLYPRDGASTRTAILSTSTSTSTSKGTTKRQS